MRWTKEIMLLKTLFLNHDYQIEPLLFKIHKELGLSSHELTVLIALIQIYRKKEIFSLNALSKRIDFSKNDLGIYVDNLMNKGFLTIYLKESKNNKTKEGFHLDDMFSKIETLILNQTKINKKDNRNDLKKSIIKIETYLNRMLKPSELEQLRELFDVEGFTFSDIDQVTEQLKEQVSIKKIQRLLVIQSRLPKQPIDAETDKALENLYKAIK